MATVIMMDEIANTHVKIIKNAPDMQDGCIQSFTDREGTEIQVKYSDAEFIRMVADSLLDAADSLEDSSCE